MMSNIIFDIKNIDKTYESTDKNRKDLKVIEDFSLKIRENEFLCIIGPSGCGKSTLLRILAGLEDFQMGEVLFRNKPLRGTGMERGMVFQSYSLMPWLNVRDNIGLGLKFKNMGKKEKDEIIDEHLDMINLTDFAYAYPSELSGGMQQRVAIARSLANNPEVILMDEPFGALDAHTRIQLQRELLRIWESHKKTIVFITHSVDEAIYLGDRIIMMSKDKGSIFKEVEVDLPRPRERSNSIYANLNEELLDDFEKLHGQ